MACLEREVPPMPLRVPLVRRPERPVGHVDEGALDGPYVPLADSPFDSPEASEVNGSVSVDAARPVDVRVEVAPDEVAERAEHGPAAEKPWVSGLRDGAPSAASPEDEHDVVEVVDGFHVEEQRRIPVLLHDRRRGQGSLEAVRGPKAGDDPERSEGLASPLVVVWKPAEPPLNALGRAKPLGQRPFPRGERIPPRSGRERFRARTATHPGRDDGVLGFQGERPCEKG